MNRSIFENYYYTPKLIDAFQNSKKDAVDVIIPVLNTNDLWRVNLLSFYRSIPINRLLIGDGGCTDKTLDILNDFPRVEIFDFNGTSLGYRIRKLIELVKTDHFAYLHSDVYLPDDWFMKMNKYKNQYDWFESNRRITVLLELNMDVTKIDRALSGSQFGNTAVMKKASSSIEDDYSYRQEDIIFAELVQDQNGKYGKVLDTFHYHQLMNKEGAEIPNYRSFSIEREKDTNNEIMIYNTQVRGFIKYLTPKKPYVINDANAALYQLNKLGGLNWKEFRNWVLKTNPEWLKVLKPKGPVKQQVKDLIKRIIGR